MISINYECWYYVILEWFRVIDDLDGDIIVCRIFLIKCVFGKKCVKNYIFILVGGRGNMFIYFVRIGFLLKMFCCY